MATGPANCETNVIRVNRSRCNLALSASVVSAKLLDCSASFIVARSIPDTRPASDRESEKRTPSVSCAGIF